MHRRQPAENRLERRLKGIHPALGGKKLSSQEVSPFCTRVSLPWYRSAS
jgi:hypothetical protein